MVFQKHAVPNSCHELEQVSESERVSECLSVLVCQLRDDPCSLLPNGCEELKAGSQR